MDLMDVGSLFQDLFSLENADYKQKKMLHVWNIYIWTIFGVNVGKYSIHGASGTYWSHGELSKNCFLPKSIKILVHLK